jgi:hypothetical protein
MRKAPANPSLAGFASYGAALPASPSPLAASDFVTSRTFPAAASKAASRWSASAWTFVRRGEATQLAPGGTLGGSQAGARLTYRLGSVADGPLALSARIYSPLKNARGAEAALGVEWQPVPVLPVRLLAERRQAIGKEGRSAFALMAYGGVSDRGVVGPVRMDLYAQAGVVGAGSRDFFVDGSLSIGVPVDGGERLKVGVGAWAAAQPGVSRVDAGPQLSVKLPVEGRNIRLSVDWRLRVAGDAAPGSGPALTLSTDF